MTYFNGALTNAARKNHQVNLSADAIISEQLIERDTLKFCKKDSYRDIDVKDGRG